VRGGSCLTGRPVSALGPFPNFDTPKYEVRLCPHQRTSSAWRGTSDKCQQETHAPQQATSLFDDLVGTNEQARRDSYLQCPRGFEVDHEFKFGRLLYRQVTRLCTLENFINE